MRPKRRAISDIFPPVLSADTFLPVAKAASFVTEIANCRENLGRQDSVHSAGAF